MTNYSPRLILTFDETFKLERTVRWDMATYLLQVLATRGQLITAVRTLFIEIESIFGIKVNLGSHKKKGSIDFLTGKDRGIISQYVNEISKP